MKTQIHRLLIALCSLTIGLSACSDNAATPGDKTCTWKGVVYQDQQEWKDDCNSCKCNPGGTVGAACTSKGCPSTDGGVGDGGDRRCTYKGKVYKDQDEFKDDCNSCKCNPAGSTGVGCTQKACNAATCDKTLAANDSVGITSVIAALTWNSVGPYTSTLEKVSIDVKTMKAITVAASQIALPSSCGGCRPQVAFTIAKGLKGVTCKKTSSFAWLTTCDEVELAAGTTVRFRAQIFDTHPAQYNAAPIVEIIADCKAPCGANELRCDANNTCFSDFEAYCRLCLVKDKTVCPCLTATGNKADKTACSFAVSGDVKCSGECKAGTCNYTGTPGAAGCP